MEKDRIKSYPFCDGKVEVIRSPIGVTFLRCVECGHIVSFDMERCNKHPEKAIEAFNRRVVSHDERRNVTLN